MASQVVASCMCGQIAAWVSLEMQICTHMASSHAEPGLLTAELVLE
jgi:hypothetical protein